jgi:two-component system, NtrC family, response regulator GlrR
MTDRPQPEITKSLPLPGLATARTRVHAWSVEVVWGPDRGRKISNVDRLLRIGTDPACDLVLTDRTVSAQHAELERTSLGWMVRDLRSRNGVLLEGRRVLEAVVESGDQLVLGKTRLRVTRSAEPDELEILEGDRFGELFGASEPMRAAFAALRRAAREELSLLIEGETGTGKELAARAVHAHSARRDGPFAVVDCNVLQGVAAVAELQPGPLGIPPLLEAAAGGTLFLDEIGELPSELQPLLLRAAEAPSINARIIASSQRNLDEEVRQARFRRDLFFRIAGARVRLPPLRARREEIPALATHLLAARGRSLELAPQALALFDRYDWPGNVRELRNVLDRGAAIGDAAGAPWLDFLDFPANHDALGRAVVELSKLSYHQAKDRVVGRFERVYFAEVMKECGFDLKVAEHRTGLSMQSLYRLLKKNGLRLKDLQ